MVSLEILNKFTQIPFEVHLDIIKGKLISNDLVVYNYLVSKGAHGKAIYLSNKKMGGDLGGMSYGKISASLSRLNRAGHIERTKTSNNTATILKTLVLAKGELMIRGKI